MNFLNFIIAYPFIWFFSKLPMSILYFISDFFYFIIYRIIGYRKKIVFYNLKAAFPNKTNKELKSIEKKFFKHLSDLIFESIKLLSISEKNIKKRYHYKNINVINDLYKKGKSIALVGSHHNNWEWSTGLPLQTKYSCFLAYSKIKNPYFNKLIRSMRTKFKYGTASSIDFTKIINKRIKNNIQSIYLLLSDQTPRLDKTRHWKTFFNKFVPIHIGAEILAKKNNFAIVNMNVFKIKRGFYEIQFDTITENPRNYENYKITDLYIKLTEEQIKKQPENYLWSHRRFKHENQYESWKKNIKKKPN